MGLRISKVPDECNIHLKETTVKFERKLRFRREKSILYIENLKKRRTCNVYKIPSAESALKF